MNRWLELFDEPGENMGYSKLDVLQVVESGYALAQAQIGIYRHY